MCPSVAGDGCYKSLFFHENTHRTCLFYKCTFAIGLGGMLSHAFVGERTGLVVRASDSGSGDPGLILGPIVLFP